jgi:ADP-ribose pyrophosphatase YjhB (NUDIX family)
MKIFLLAMRLLMAAIQRALYFLTAGEWPSCACVAVVIRAGGKILMVERRDGNGLGLPGGHIKQGETVEAAAHREVKEETGLSLEITRFLGTLSGKRPGVWLHAVDIVYEGRIAGGALSDSGEGRVRWVNLADVREQVAFDYLKILDKV